MAERRSLDDGGAAPAPLAGVVLPVAILLVVVAVVAGLVFGGVVQGHSARVGPGASPSTEATIIIEE